MIGGLPRKVNSETSKGKKLLLRKNERAGLGNLAALNDQGLLVSLDESESLFLVVFARRLIDTAFFARLLFPLFEDAADQLDHRHFGAVALAPGQTNHAGYSRRGRAEKRGPTVSNSLRTVSGSTMNAAA